LLLFGNVIVIADCYVNFYNHTLRYDYYYGYGFLWSNRRYWFSFGQLQPKVHLNQLSLVPFFTPKHWTLYHWLHVNSTTPSYNILSPHAYHLLQLSSL